MKTRRQFLSYALALTCAHRSVSFVVAAELHAVFALELDSAGRPLVPVFLDGSGPFRFVLDTGASRSVIASQLAKQLALKPGSSVPINSTSGRIVAPSVTIEQFELGPLRFEHQQLPVVDSQLLNAAGVVGVDALVRKKIEIDFRNKQLSIGASVATTSIASGDLQSIIPAQQFSGLLLINAEVHGVACKAIVDTGAQRTIGNEALLNQLKLDKRLHTHSNAMVLTTPSGAAAASTMLPALAIEMGNVIARKDVIFTEAALFAHLGLADDPALLIGMDVLGTLSRLVIDYGKSIVVMR